MFATTVRAFHTKNRLLLTGTPLQNNLHELWALLNFLLPDIFSDSDQFDEWFDLDVDDDAAKKDMIGTLHKILRPFMLRRLKSDVAKGLPPKTETLLMVGMSKIQKELYKKLLLRDIDSLASKGETGKTAVLNIIMQVRERRVEDLSAERLTLATASNAIRTLVLSLFPPRPPPLRFRNLSSDPSSANLADTPTSSKASKTAPSPLSASTSSRTAARWSSSISCSGSSSRGGTGCSSSRR